MAARVLRRTCAAAIALAMLFAATGEAIAQDDEPIPDVAAMQRLEAAVSPQPWYPEGYYDVRVAAEAQVAEVPRASQVMIGKCPNGDGTCYELSDPLAERVAPGEADPALARFGNIALEISRLRQEMAGIGYPASVYAGPLAAYERQLVEAAAAKDTPQPGFELTAARQLGAAIEADRQRLAPALPRVIAYGGDDQTGSAGRQSIVVRSSGPAAAQYPVGRRLNRGDKLVLMAGDTVILLENGGTRTLQGPGTYGAGSASQNSAAAMGRLLSLPSRTRTGAVRSGSGGKSVIVATSPPGGEVLLVTAFAFRLCGRKRVDMWNRFACKWNEVETGVERPLSGRYVYQVRWPDGTVRKGTREIHSDFDDEATTVTFRKTGS